MSFGQTSYDWRPDVRRIVRRFERHFPTKANTYEGHGTQTSSGTIPGPSLERVSIDFWAPPGRGVPIAQSVGDRIVRRLRRRRRPPDLRYWIWWGRIHFADGTSRPYADLADPHFDHVHVTFY
jgi:hypothetical protein